ncbi:MAG: CIA30 family protein, partial [Pseudomonadota bacterium]
ERFLPNRDVWVEDGRIRALGRRLDLPDGLPRVDGTGRTVLPGLIDAHVHAFGSVREDAVRFGATTILDQFTAIEQFPGHREERSTIGFSGAADLFSAGMLATAAGGHGTQYGMPVDTLAEPAEAAGWTRDRKAAGSDWIKIVIEDGSAYNFTMPALDRDTVAAVVAAAHAEGLLAVAHVSRLSAALLALELGIDGLVHVWGDQVIDPEDAARFAEAGVFVVPTLAVIASVAGNDASAQLAATLAEEQLSPMQRDTLAGSFGSARPEHLAVALENVRALHEAGVSILAGTDAPNPGTASGLSMHVELQLLAQAGFDADEVFRAATLGPAAAFGLEDRGRIDRDRLADLVLVEGDLRADLTGSAAIAAVWKDGEPVPLELSTREQGSLPVAPDVALIADFEDGLTSSFGMGWFPSTDEVRGGGSIAELAVVDGALTISGEIRSGFPFPWAGAIWFPGDQPMAPVDFGERETLRFRVRGEPRSYTVMMFGETMSGIPPSQTFSVTDAWQEIEMPLEGFRVDGVISGVSFVAQQPHGAFAFEVDDVRID